MPRKSSTVLLFFTYYFLIGGTSALIGKKVHNAYYNHNTFVVSIASRSDIAYTDVYKLHLCTGSLISYKSVLTVAHCLHNKKPHDIEIIADSVNLNSGKRYLADSWITFDEWNKDKNWTYPMNNIAVITIQSVGIVNIRPVSILFVSNDEDIKGISIVGWGKTEKGNKVRILKVGNLNVISKKECNKRGTILRAKVFIVPPNYFCSRVEPWILSTPGDGGAPVLDRNGHLVGVNIGVTPNLAGYPYDSNFLHENQMNSHLNLYFYKDFIRHVLK